jgi:hypothetical protein
MPELPCPCQVAAYLRWFYAEAYIRVSAVNN